jgi:CheY-like chemotaxis protein
MPRARILIVDDDRNARAALGELLGDAGYEVAVAASGAEGLALVDSFRPAVLLTDLQMPGMNGRELAAASSHTASPPSVVFMSSLPRPAAEERTWLEKPIDVDELVDTIGLVTRGLGEAHAGR